MTSRLDRRTALAALLLVSFVVLTLLPWRDYNVVLPSFNPAGAGFSLRHANAWDDSRWTKVAAQAGILAGLCTLRRHRMLAGFGTLAATTALICWVVRTWQLHHPTYTGLNVSTFAVANFADGPSDGSIVGTQTAISYIAAAVLAVFLVVSVSRLSVDNHLDFVNGSRFRVIARSLVVLGLLVLPLLPWNRSLRYSMNPLTSHVVTSNAWTTETIHRYWLAAAVLGLVAAVALLIRSRAAALTGTVAAALAVGCWLTGTWQLHHPHVSGSLSSFDTNVPIGSQEVVGQTYAVDGGPAASVTFVNSPHGALGQTWFSYATLVLLLLLVALSALLLLQVRPEPVTEADQPDGD